MLFFLDAIQGLGVFPLDVRETGVDFFAADGHKWLLGPEGAGVFYCRREHLDLLRPIGVGWNSVQQGGDYNRIELNLRDTARRYEGGTQNMVGFLGLGASLNLLQELGVGPSASPVADRVLEITDAACSRLQECGAKLLGPRVAGNTSGIVTFSLPGHEASHVRNRLQEAGIVARCRGGGVRISPHGYATHDDIGRLIDVLTQLTAKGPAQ
jgi:selenocysteine lyase/cysteine desulfurase